MTYQLTKGDAVIRTADGATIPADPANTDYAAYLAWRDKGNEPEPAAPEPVIVARVRLPKLTLVDRLTKAGKIEAAISALGTGVQRIRWDASSSVDPANADVRALLAAIGCDVEAMLAPETAAEAAL